MNLQRVHQDIEIVQSVAVLFKYAHSLGTAVEGAGNLDHLVVRGNLVHHQLLVVGDGDAVLRWWS